LLLLRLLYAQTKDVVPAMNVIQQQLADIPMLKLLELKDFQSK
jgi:hypothetical protein